MFHKTYSLSSIPLRDLILNLLRRVELDDGYLYNITFCADSTARQNIITVLHNEDKKQNTLYGFSSIYYPTLPDEVKVKTTFIEHRNKYAML